MKKTANAPRGGRPSGQQRHCPRKEKENNNCTVRNALDELPKVDENHNRTKRREAQRPATALPQTRKGKQFFSKWRGLRGLVVLPRKRLVLLVPVSTVPKGELHHRVALECELRLHGSEDLIPCVRGPRLACVLELWVRGEGSETCLNYQIAQ